jgi:hypothetical protein
VIFDHSLNWQSEVVKRIIKLLDHAHRQNFEPDVTVVCSELLVNWPSGSRISFI